MARRYERGVQIVFERIAEQKTERTIVVAGFVGTSVCKEE